ncbi:MAG: hypothetical protein A3I39_01260 [Candidatus Yanofskybacteria bacterium RIFCSPLOWO2_02_FULL_47_9b]|uniref:Uncharacterized protein n=1 Tax=Candidatus Yanofskybacteria bacterium RIFCSPLOWO2_02_FULL_47_9b TaxID=1802708 RepID=A0A1F8H7M7_9BACT|nr:MAG: hypothetical protein A3I39_01260 [Candidatus Yanofskybacteria bacterium RIFCSPLOWO2_02_FULL_47_9b]
MPEIFCKGDSVKIQPDLWRGNDRVVGKRLIVTSVVPNESRHPRHPQRVGLREQDGTVLMFLTSVPMSVEGDLLRKVSPDEPDDLTIEG